MTHISNVVQYLSHRVWLFKIEPLGSSILLQDYDIIIFFLMTEWCSIACIWKLVPRLCPFWVAITEPLRLGNLWGKEVYFGLYAFHSSVDRHFDYFNLMNITAMDTATIFALKWYEDHRQQLCRKTGGTTSHLSFWTDRRQNRQNGKATCRSKKIIYICIVNPALLSKTFKKVIQIKQNQETNHLLLSPQKWVKDQNRHFFKADIQKASA